MSNWQEGDALSPTNLNIRVPSWVSSSANTGIIFPSLISGMIGPVINVKTDFGAKGDGSTDDNVALQAALDFASNNTTTRRVWFPQGNYTTSKPLWVRGASIFGESAALGIGSTVNASQIAPVSYVGGPILCVQGSNASLSGLTTALATGVGQAITITDNSHWFNLRDASQLDLNGLAAITVECFYKSSGAPVSRNLIGSSGRLLAGDTATTAVSFQVDFAGRLQGQIKLSGINSNVLTGSTINDGVKHHLALSYDGTTLRLFTDGALSDSQAITGTVTQGLDEGIWVGPTGDLADQTLSTSGPGGTLDSIRISDNARYTAAFTAPTAKFVNDAHTLILMNFESQLGLLTLCRSATGDIWLPMRVIDDTMGGGPFEAYDISISDNVVGKHIGIYMVPNVYNWRMHHIWFANLRTGLFIAPGGNAYWWSLSDIFLNSLLQGRYGIWLGAGAGIGTASNIWTQGCKYHLAANGSDIALTNWFMQGDTSTVIGMAFINQNNSGAPPTLRGVMFNREPGVGSNFRSPLAFGGTININGIVAQGCVFESAGTAPFAIVDAPQASKFIGCGFSHFGTPASIIQVRVTNNLKRPVQFDQCEQLSGWAPWSDTTGTASVGLLGTQSSTSTRGSVLFDASQFDSWDLTLTSDVTQSNWSKINYGQPVSGAIKMDSTGSRLFTWPTNSKGTVTLSYGSAAINTFAGFYDGVNVILTSVRTGL